MNMNIRFLSCWFIASSLAFGANVRIVSQSATKLVVEMHADEISYERVVRRTHPFTAVKVDNDISMGLLGAPELPVVGKLLAVRKNTQLLIESIQAVPKRIALAAPISYNDGTINHCKNQALPVAPQPKHYEKAKNDVRAEITNTSYMGPVRAALLVFRPVLLVNEKKLSEAKTIRVVISVKPARQHENSPVNPEALDTDTANLFSTITLPTVKLSRGNRGPKVDLMIVHNSYESSPSLASLIFFKGEAGRLVRLKFLGSTTTSEVKELIKKEYASSSPPTHTLIIGSIDQIPSFKRSGYWTDYPYQLIDSGELPDLSIGRIAARNTAELAASIEKIIAREKNPRENSKVLVTSGYETGWCHVNLAYIMSKIFAPSEIPLSITKLYASEGAKTDKVIEAYNRDPNLIVYDGHGDQNAMTEIPLAISHLKSLSNRVYPLIFDIACLNSYWPSSGASSNNFAQSMAVLSRAGAAGILAASSSANAHDLFRYVFRAFVYDELTPNDTFHRLNEAGHAILYGKLKYYEKFGGSALDDNYMFYWHGDPASTAFAK